MAPATACEMTGWTRLPIRVRLTAAFAVGLALSLAALGAFVYLRTGASLLAAEDAGMPSLTVGRETSARNSRSLDSVK